MGNALKKEDTITVRLSAEHKEILKTAASFKGQDLTSYLMGYALDHAMKDIQEFKAVEKLVLSERDFAAVNAVDERTPSMRMKEKAQDYKKSPFKKNL